MTRITGTLHEDRDTFSIISCSFLLKMENVLDQSCRQSENTTFMFGSSFFFNCTVYEKMWENTVELGRPWMTMWCMGIACWVPEATNTHPQYIILILFCRYIGRTNAPDVTLYAYCLSCSSINLFKLVILDERTFLLI